MNILAMRQTLDIHKNQLSKPAESAPLLLPEKWCKCTFGLLKIYFAPVYKLFCAFSLSYCKIQSTVLLLIYLKLSKKNKTLPLIDDLLSDSEFTGNSFIFKEGGWLNLQIYQLFHDMIWLTINYKSVKKNSVCFKMYRHFSLFLYRAFLLKQINTV